MSGIKLLRFQRLFLPFVPVDSDDAAFHRAGHPWDGRLRQHVLTTHLDCIHQRAQLMRVIYIYIQRNVGGALVDRMTFAYITAVHNDARIKATIWFACFGVSPHTGRIRSEGDHGENGGVVSVII